jgi:Family of unknown function (DUF6174)
VAAAPGTAARVPPVIRRSVLALTLAAAVTGCTSSPDPAPTAAPPVSASPPAWTEPAAYGFVLERRCDGGPPLGRYRVRVEGGAVASAERIDGQAASGEEEIEVPTLGGLVEMADVALADGAAATVAYDPVDGHPTAVTIDRSDETGPAAECFLISEYAPTS